MSTRLMQVVTLDDAKRGLSEALGPAYRFTDKSDSSFTAHRTGVMGVTITMTWADGATTFKVRPNGAVLVLLYNALYTTPKVRRALIQAFPES